MKDLNKIKIYMLSFLMLGNFACFEEEKELSPFYQAIRAGDQVKVQESLKLGAKINGREGEYGDTPLIWAIRNGQTDLAIDLMEQGADLKILNYDLWTPLHIAAWTDNKKITEHLIEKEVSLNVESVRGDTPLDLAKVRNSHSVLLLLKEKGARGNLGPLGVMAGQMTNPSSCKKPFENSNSL